MACGVSIAVAAPPVRFVGPTPGLHDQFSALAISPDGEFIVAVGRSEVHVWGKDGAIANGMEGWGGLAFSGDGKRLVTGRSGGTVGLYDRLPAGDTLVLLGSHSGAVNCVAHARRATVVASGGDDNEVRLWDPDAGRLLRTLEGHEGLICAVALSADGKLVASASLDLTVRLWDGTTGKQLHCLEGHRDQVRGLAFSPDGKHLFTAGMDGIACQWDVRSGKEVRRLVGHRGGVRGLSLSDDGKVLATAGEDGTVRIWDVATGREQHRIDVCSHGVSAVALFPDGGHVVTADLTGAVLQWDTRTGRKVQTVKESILKEDVDGMVFRPACLAWSPDGHWIATGGLDHWVRLWNAATGKQVRPLGRHTDMVWSVVFSPDGKHVASAGRRDGLVHLWEASTGKPVYRFGRGHRGGISRLAWSADGKQLVSAGGSFDPALHVWEAASGRLLRRLDPKGYGHITDGLGLTADGRWAVSTWEHTIRLWDLVGTRHRQLGVIPRKGMLAVDPGGAFAATSGEGPFLTLWDLEDEVTRRIEGHDATTSAVAVSSDGCMLAAGDQAGNVYLWECGTGQLRGRFSTGTGSIDILAFRPDARALAVHASGASPWIIDLRSIPEARTRPIPTEDSGLAAECTHLSGEDACRAWQAMQVLAEVKDRAVRLLSKQIRLPAAVPAERIERWLRDLDSDTFAVRERATEQLRQVGRPARPALQRALAALPSPEAKRRIESLLDLTGFAASPEERRTMRALEVLEEIGTPAARGVLERVAKGGDAGPARTARAALQRLQRRDGTR
jgi:WD40 repeat protein